MALPVALAQHKWEKGVEIGGFTLKDINLLIKQMEVWKQILPAEDYNQYLDEGASVLSDMSATLEELNDTYKEAWYQLGRTTRHDFEAYRQTKRYKELWSDIEKAAQNKAANLAKRAYAQKEIKKIWGDRGAEFLNLNEAYGFTYKSRNLAKRVPDYGKAMKYLNRVMYQRRSRGGKYQQCSLTPGGTDLQNALELAEQFPDGVPALSTEELLRFGPEFEMSIGHNGLLTHGLTLTGIIGEETDSVTGLQKGNAANDKNDRAVTEPPKIPPTTPPTASQGQNTSSAVTAPPKNPSTTPSAASQGQDTSSAVTAPPKNPHTTQPTTDDSVTRLQTGTPGNAPSQTPVSDQLSSTVTHPLNSQQQDSIDDVMDNGCMCVMNEFLTIQIMRTLDALSSHWSLESQKRTSEIVRQNSQALRDITDQLSNGKRLACEGHTKKLAMAIGLRAQTSYELRLERLAKISEMANFADFTTRLLHGNNTFTWFRNGKKNEPRPKHRNVLAPWRSKPVLGIEQMIGILTEKIRSNHEQILIDVMSIYGQQDFDSNGFAFEGFVDFVNVFKWIFDGPLSVITTEEARIHQHHLKSEMKVGKITDHQCRSQQFGLVQQVVESHPIFYLLNILLHPRQEKEIFFVSWPNSTIYTLEDSTQFHFPSKPQRSLEEKALRAIVPISMENIKSCDCILIGTADPQDLRQTMKDYNSHVSKPGFEGRKQQGAVLDQEILEQVLSTDKYHVRNSPIPLGAVRLLRSTVATSSRGSRYALQPQLLRVRDYFSNEATLENGVPLQDVADHRLSSWPMQQSAYGEKLAESRAPFVHDPLSGISPLAEAIGLRRSFDDYSVLSELGILLGGDLPAIQSYVQSWELAANSLVTLRFQALSHTERVVYQDKSHSSGQSSQMNIESDIELESEEEKDNEDDYVDKGSVDSK